MAEHDETDEELAEALRAAASLRPDAQTEEALLVRLLEELRAGRDAPNTEGGDLPDLPDLPTAPSATPSLRTRRNVLLVAAAAIVVALLALGLPRDSTTEIEPSIDNPAPTPSEEAIDAIRAACRVHRSTLESWWLGVPMVARSDESDDDPSLVLLARQVTDAADAMTEAVAQAGSIDSADVLFEDATGQQRADTFDVEIPDPAFDGLRGPAEEAARLAGLVSLQVESGALAESEGASSLTEAAALLHDAFSAAADLGVGECRPVADRPTVQP